MDKQYTNLNVTEMLSNINVHLWSTVANCSKKCAINDHGDLNTFCWSLLFSIAFSLQCKHNE